MHEIQISFILNSYFIFFTGKKSYLYVFLNFFASGAFQQSILQVTDPLRNQSECSILPDGPPRNTSHIIMKFILLLPANFFQFRTQSHRFKQFETNLDNKFHFLEILHYMYNCKTQLYSNMKHYYHNYRFLQNIHRFLRNKISTWC